MENLNGRGQCSRPVLGAQNCAITRLSNDRMVATSAICSLVGICLRVRTGFKYAFQESERLPSQILLMFAPIKSFFILAGSNPCPPEEIAWRDDGVMVCSWEHHELCVFDPFGVGLCMQFKGRQTVASTTKNSHRHVDLGCTFKVRRFRHCG